MSQTSGPGGASSDPEQQVAAESLDIAYAQLPQGVAAAIVAAPVIAYVQSDVTSVLAAAIWLALVVGVSLARLAIFVARRRRPPEERANAFWRSLFLVTITLSGMSWGSAALLIFPPGMPADQALVGLALAGLSGAAVGTLATHYRAYLVFSLSVCGPFTTRLFTEGGEVQLTMALLTVIFLIATSLTARRTNAATYEALRLRFEKVELVGNLERMNRDLVHEVRERERSEAALVESVKAERAATEAKGQFLANMSHEIRTPMNGILGMADILGRSELTSRQGHQVALIQRSARTLLGLINDILDVSRIEAGHVELEVAPFDLEEVVCDAAEVVADDAQGKRLEIAVDLADCRRGLVLGDAMRLKQVLVNLVGNAVKFTEAGSVVVRAAVTEGAGANEVRLHFSVKDTGIGIDPAKIQSLFEPFRQADASITRRFGGTGLGLAISARLVALMGGSLACDSTPGVGTCFHFTLTLRTGEEAGARPDAAIAGSLPPSVLLACACATTRELLARQLRAWGLPVTIVTSGQQAVEALSAAARAGEPVPTVLASAMLPDLDGLSVVERLLDAVPGRRPRVVLLTPIRWPHDSGLARAHPEVTALTVPLRPSHLLRVLCPVAGVPERKARTVSGPALRGRVLVVDDNPVNQEVAAAYLRDLGLVFDIAGDGAEALAAASRIRYDAILMDCQMPVMGGLEATRLLREAEAQAGSARTPIIALTAGAFAGERAGCLAAGMDDHLSKPVARADLTAALQRWLPPAGAAAAGEIGAGETGASETGAGAAHAERRASIESGDAPGAGPAADRTACAAPPAVDLERLADLRRAAPGLLQRLIPIFLAHARAQQQRLEAAATAGQTVAAKTIAHSLKSSSATVAAERLATLYAGIEARADAGDATAVRGLVREAGAELHRAEAALEAFDGAAPNLRAAG